MLHPVVTGRREPLPWARRPQPFAAVTLARILASRSPATLMRVLTSCRRGAAHATVEDVCLARDDVLSVSVRCAGSNCLTRSIATALLCRIRGVWPTWCTGVRTTPFEAHAWIEVDGEPVGETFPPGHYRTSLTVPRR